MSSTPKIKLTSFRSTGNNLTHLFNAVNKNRKTSKIISDILSKKEAIHILLEGSGYLVNIDIINELLAPRNHAKDLMVLIDINKTTISNFTTYIKQRFPRQNYQTIQADMNSLPLQAHSIDLVIHNFTVNFNTTKRNDALTLLEIKRVLKPTESTCLFSVGILASPNNKTNSYSSLSGEAVVNQSEFYYESLFQNVGFQYIKFDSSKNTSTFPYNRYILQLNEAANSR